MVIERELNKFLLQLREGKQLYFVHYTHNRTFFTVENSVISFFPYFPHGRKPNDIYLYYQKLSTFRKSNLSIIDTNLNRLLTFFFLISYSFDPTKLFRVGK